MDDLDFDAWCELAQQRPEQYFRERERLIEGYIASHPLPQQERLREFQLQIDRARAVAGSPLRATRMMMSMMEDQLEALHDRLLCLQAETESIARLMNEPRDPDS
ncbi:MAG: DUF3135 domain-containing protein [Rhodocyclaceae bacterium]|nr:DUF3135 domain-containing protein [Rhodocyclaceae bacterium]